ncbi:MAG TPA: alpha/beta hydrolase [Panacibacter sp.]|nr:alpha/beta hydrolase [Panacibacter sp.]HNP45075.1 alpha/beta hydrolase [Panacibacter sp.]
MKATRFLLFGLILLGSVNHADAQKQLRHFMQTADSPAGEIQYGNNVKAGHYVQSGDAKIYYEEYGKGEPFVVLHGGAYGSIYEMYQFIDSLSEKYQVIAVSTRGHGRSEIGTAPVTYEQKANDIMAVINEVTKDSVTILGFSDGAYTGYKIAAMYPARVKKLVAIGAGEQIPGLRQVMLDTKVAFSLDSLYWKQQLSLMPQPERLQEYWNNLAHFYNSMMAGKELFNSIRCPVLVMAGENDRNAALATVIAAYQMIPNSQLAIIPNAPHPVFLVNFPAVWESIKPFLKQ